MRSRGMCLQESDSIVVIITWNSDNRKTGDLSQVIILNKNIDPITAVKTGQDEAQCLDCKHRPINNNTCYVNIGHSPRAIYGAYKKNLYDDYNEELLEYNLKYKKVRLGSYGEPVLIKLEIIEKLLEYSKGFTGYSHQWTNPKYAPYFKYLMASVDSTDEKFFANAMGYKTYRVAKPSEPNEPDEILCPNDKGVQCRECMLCNALKLGKNIRVDVHGAKHKVINFIKETK